VNDPGLRSSFGKKIGIAACLAIMLHILLCLLVLILPQRAVVANPITSLYRTFMIIGPFFYEARIKSTPHLLVSVYRDGSWSLPIEHRMNSLRAYRQQPWRYDVLRKYDFEEYIASQVGTIKKRHDFDKVMRSKAFRELNQFVVLEYTDKPVDSLSLLYVVKVYSTMENSYKSDTIFNFTYNPADIAPGKR
jgi:hypothetical protein